MATLHIIIEVRLAELIRRRSATSTSGILRGLNLRRGIRETRGNSGESTGGQPQSDKPTTNQTRQHVRTLWSFQGLMDHGSMIDNQSS
ncbi:hypothetical protein EVAR_91932_1 [Eumeta japonica]|uniref:Uncharacterized protein n=1 Tax=Eumeta variegata TaxID=151549 RepID=A0A4C1SZR9_EUMVA|nr:hypothetical protein EVAR_91932_1 [Eumeta japonica]